MTLAPWAVAPRANAPASGPEDVRMSWTITTSPAPVSRMKAAPTASATPSLSSPGTTPRMSYALMIFAKSATAARASCAPADVMRPDACGGASYAAAGACLLPAAKPSGYGTRGQSLPSPALASSHLGRGLPAAGSPDGAVSGGAERTIRR